MLIFEKIRNAMRSFKVRKSGLLMAREVVCTCEAHPTQYEISLSDGRLVYANFRWGKLSIFISPRPTKNIHDAILGEQIYFADTGSEYGGIMSEPHFSNHLGLAGICLMPDLPIF
jgi:hypothetical protein